MSIPLAINVHQASYMCMQDVPSGLRSARFHPRLRCSALFLFCFPWFLFLAGCGSGVVTISKAIPVAISASAVSIAPGGSSVLSVTAANATQVTITGSDGSHYTLPATGGTQTITPTVTTTYTAVATSASGAIVSSTVTVTVTSAALPNVTIAASPASISTGASSSLSVTASGATQVIITGSDGSSYPLQAAGGTQTVTPGTTTTYTATATGPGGKVSATATVTVAPAVGQPTVAISANPTSISAGGSSVLTVSATNASQVTVTGTDGSSYALSPTGGAQTVTPAATTTYTAVASGAAGKVSSTVTVTVAAAVLPGVAITANPASVAAGASSTLTITATNAAQVTVSGSDGTAYTLPSTGGTEAVTPNATTTYTATATGAGTAKASATATVTVVPAATVAISASPSSITPGGSSVLTVTATNATQVTITGSDGSSYTLPVAGGSQPVTPSATTTYTANASGSGAPATAKTTVAVGAAGSLQSINHVIFMLQENHAFDAYFGMLNPYRVKQGWTTGDDGKTYAVDGIDDKLTKISNQDDEGTSYAPFKFTSTCVDDLTSGWLESYGDVSRYDFSPTRRILMDGFVHTAENYASSCQKAGGASCAGTFSDSTGKRAMGYYDETFLNYYYFMASEFAVSDRWFSPLSSKSVPNRIATFTGGTTQGLVEDPGNDDHLTQLPIPTIFGELTKANVSWRIYYTVTQGACLSSDECSGKGAAAAYPATEFSYLSDSGQFLYENPTKAACNPGTQSSSLPPVNDPSGSFCIDVTHIAPLSSYYTDLTNGSLPSFAFIEAGYGVNDEHPGSGQSILNGQQEVAKVVNALVQSPAWMQSVFFLAYDEGGGPYDHVPPVPHHSNDFTDATVGSATQASIPDISGIAVNPDGQNTYYPCLPSTPGTPTQHCDLKSDDPGANANDAATIQGFAAQLGFRVPNMIISPFARRHYVGHNPMEHTAILKFVENRFIGPSAHLTARDAAQPDLLDFFDFTAAPWANPPAAIPAPATPSTLGYDPCTPTSFGP